MQEFLKAIFRITVPIVLGMTIIAGSCSRKKGESVNSERGALTIAFESRDWQVRIPIADKLELILTQAFKDYRAGRGEKSKRVFGRPWGSFIQGTNWLAWQGDLLYGRESVYDNYLVLEKKELEILASEYLRLSKNNSKTLSVEEWEVLFKNVTREQ
jgi:hypothetical protein